MEWSEEDEGSGKERREGWRSRNRERERNMRRGEGSGEENGKEKWRRSVR